MNLSIRRIIISTVVSLAPVIYVGMQSMGDVGIFEILLLGVFELLACFFYT